MKDKSELDTCFICSKEVKCSAFSTDIGNYSSKAKLHKTLICKDCYYKFRKTKFEDFEYFEEFGGFEKYNNRKFKNKQKCKKFKEYTQNNPKRNFKKKPQTKKRDV